MGDEGAGVVAVVAGVVIVDVGVAIVAAGVVIVDVGVAIVAAGLVVVVATSGLGSTDCLLYTSPSPRD